ncbi:MAG TPA: PilN domain-containing protein [Stellaceae bacterium]|nr:PilN domain-containing protein [Stellaceae bacterium]
MSARLAAIAALLQRLFQWWIGELATFVPERLRHRLATVTDTLVVLLGEGEAVLCLETRQEVKSLGRIDLRGEGEAHRVTALLRQHGLARELAGGKAPICLRLGAERALHTIVDLPLAAEANLDEVVSFELDRHTPFRADQAAFSHRVLERDPAAQRIRIELMVVPRPIIDQALAVAQRLQLDADRIDIADDGGTLAGSGNLLPSRSPVARQRGHERTLVYALAAAAAALAVVAVYLPVHSMQRTADSLREQFEAAKKSAVAAAALQKEIDALRKDELFLVDRKRDRPTVSKLLLEATGILPDDTWLSEWQLAGSEMQLTGYAGSASALINLLEQSKIFHNTTFQSPVVQDSKSGRERFHVATQIAGEDAP